MERDVAVKMIQEALSKTISGDTGEALAPETDLVGDGMIDSLEAMKFIFELEKAAGLEIAEVDLEATDFYRVDKLVDYILTRSA